MSIFDKLKSYSDVVEIAIKGVEKEWVKIEMGAYGEVYNGVCFGCMATNALCELNQKAFDESTIFKISLRAEFLKEDKEKVSYFEQAIDYLRSGRVYEFSHYINRSLGFKKLPYEFIMNWKHEWRIDNDNYKNTRSILTPFLEDLKEEGL